MLCVLGIVGLGAWSWIELKKEAYPDVGDTQVVVITTFAGRAAEEVEQQVTIPLERALNAVPRVATRRSRTIFGLSVITLSFEDGVEDYFARARVIEKLGDADLPDGVTPTLGPLSGPTDEIFRYVLEGPPEYTPMQLRTLQDWVVVPHRASHRIVAQIVAFNAHSEPERRAMKYQAMCASSFAFFRGTAHLAWSWLADRSVTLPDAPHVWCTGDLHLENFGTFRGENGLAYFDLNDFDEAALAPATWEVSRFVTSVFVAADGGVIDSALPLPLAAAFLDAYRSALIAGKAQWIERATATGIVRTLLHQVKRRATHCRHRQPGVRTICLAGEADTRLATVRVARRQGSPPVNPRCRASRLAAVVAERRRSHRDDSTSHAGHRSRVPAWRSCRLDGVRAARAAANRRPDRIGFGDARGRALNRDAGDGPGHRLGAATERKQRRRSTDR